MILRRKYREGYSYKSQKAKSSNSGSTKKNKAKGPTQVHKSHSGQKVLLVNMSDVPLFCESTGTQLPFRGMVVRGQDGKLYSDFDAL